MKEKEIYNWAKKSLQDVQSALESNNISMANINKQRDGIIERWKSAGLLDKLSSSNNYEILKIKEFISLKEGKNLHDEFDLFKFSKAIKAAFDFVIRIK